MIFLAPPSLIQYHRNLRSLAGFCPLSQWRAAPGSNRRLPEGETPSALPAKLTARVEGSEEFLVSTTATTLDAPGAYSRGRE